MAKEDYSMARTKKVSRLWLFDRPLLTRISIMPLIVLSCTLLSGIYGSAYAAIKHEPQDNQQHQHHEHMKMDQKETEPAKVSQPAGPAITLDQLEQMALANNPTLAQAESDIKAAEGRWKQAGLYPNPIVGYSGQEFSFRYFDEKSEHFFFVEQNIVTGGKLSKSRKVAAGEKREAEVGAESQRQRVLNAVRMLYYEALGAQSSLDLQQELVRVAREASETSKELLNVGQADQPDLLEAQNEADKAELDLLRAQNNRDQVWQMLASVVGNPTLPVSRLAGSLEDGIQPLDRQTLLDGLIQNSPEIKRAEARVDRARAELTRARAQQIPDIFIRGQIGYSNEVIETRASLGATTGPEASVEVGFRLPLFDRNQGNIGVALAGVTEAENEVRRQQLALRAKFAQAFRDYEDAARAVEKYKDSILPRAAKAHELYAARYKEMAAAYPQVIIAERNMYQVRQEYVRWLVALQESTATLKGFLLSGGLDWPGSSGESAPSKAAERSGLDAGPVLR